MSKTLGFITLCVIIISIILIFVFKCSRCADSHIETTPMSALKTTPLHKAASDGDLVLVKKLVHEGYSIGALDKFGHTALIIAIESDHVEVARWLLAQGAQMSYQYRLEETADERKKLEESYREISAGQKEYNEEIFKDLPEDLREELTSDEAIKSMGDSMIDSYFETQKIEAIGHSRSSPMLEMLITEYGADINHVDDTGYWPLSCFAEDDDIEVVTWLLENKANPNTTSTGETAIYKAIYNNNLEMVKLFLKHGARLDIEDVDGCGPLWGCRSVEMAKLLIENGADPTSTDQANFPVWHFIDDLPTKKYIEQQAKKNKLR